MTLARRQDPGTVMRALTFFRPWPNAILHSTKACENRSWMPPEWLCGARIAIHAGQRYEVGAWPRHLWTPPPPSQCTASAVVGTARLLGALKLDGEKRRTTMSLMLGGIDPGALARRLWELDKDPWWSGPCGWLLDDVIAIPPVSCKGHQGIWKLPPEVQVVVRARELAAFAERASDGDERAAQVYLDLKRQMERAA